MDTKIKKSTHEMQENLRSISRWFTYLRVVSAAGVSFILGILLGFNIIHYDIRIVLFVVIPVFLILTAVWDFWSRRGVISTLFLYGQLIVDLVIISVVVYFTGGIQGEFIFLYLLAVISAALISLRAVVFVGLLSLVFTGVLVFIGPPAPAIFSDEHADIFHHAILVLLIVLVAFESYFYISRIRKNDEEIKRMKDDFFFRTVHDLRSPFNAIRWIVEKYSQPEYIRQYPEAEKDISMMKDLNARILRLLKDLSEVVKGEAVDVFVARELVLLPTVISRVLKEFEPSLAEHRVVCFYQPPENLPLVVADSAILKEVFGNLIDNAIKYNKPGGSLTISHEIDGGYVKTLVKDTGQGIAEKDLPKLFTPYFRGDGHTEIPGTGLGLYIVKKLVEKLQGKVTVLSRIYEGSTFTVSLPVSGKTS